MEFTKLISVQEISRHASPSDCWIVVDDQVWDVTAFAPSHPGGVSLVLKYAGHDATQAYAEYHAPSIIKEHLPLSAFRGNLDRSTIDSSWNEHSASNTSSKTTQPRPADTEKPPLHSIINAHDFEVVASRTASPKTFAFYSTAATDC